jgi:hypothetical protein
LKSTLFEKFGNETIEMHNLSSIKGGTSGSTGDNDCTGDAMSPDCGDNATGTNRDINPTELNSDTCNG